MTKAKSVSAKDWRNRPIETWTVTSFTEYLKDSHKERFGVDYAPMRSWGIEQGMLGDLIGTQARKNPKPRTATNSQVKRFIDECFATYTPNAQYPGTSFGFSYAYKKNVWQRIQMEEKAQAKRLDAIAEAGNEDWDEVSEWL